MPTPPCVDRTSKQYAAGSKAFKSKYFPFKVTIDYGWHVSLKIDQEPSFENSRITVV
jgi:hypothetical protein